MPDIQKRKITTEELKSLVDNEISRANGLTASDLSADRARALDRYNGDPLGTEMEGRSRVHTRDVLETIEWILPTLIRIFTATEKAVELIPIGQEDEEQALQETMYLNHLFYQKNDGFLVMYSWFKDALLSKNGIVKAYVEEVTEITEEKYFDMLDEEFQALLSDEEVEVIEHSSEVKNLNLNGQIIPIKTHDATITRTCKDKKICIDPVAPEDFIISNDARSVDPSRARFSAQKSRLTVSELREMGYSDKEIRLMDFSSTTNATDEQQARKQFAQEIDMETNNISQQIVTMMECYYKVDIDGDGIAELCKIMRSGDFIEFEKVDYNPFHALTPIILTHKFYGLSVADITCDIQEQRTMLRRAYFDNVNQTINGTTYYDENRVNVDDMLSSVPFGIRAVDGTPGDSVFYIPPQGLPPTVFSLDELLDKTMNDRVGDFRTPLDPNVLATAQTGVVINALNEAKSKVEMIARIFAEVGVKKLFLTLHHLARKYSTREDSIKLRNTYVPVKPQEWRERTNMRVNVGLGTQNRAEVIANLQQIASMQLQFVQAGIPSVVPKNFYNAAREMTEAMGHLPDKFFTAPEQIPPPPPQQDPNDKLIQAQLVIEQGKAQIEREKAQLTMQQKMGELQLKAKQMEIEQGNALSKAEIERIRAQLEHIKALNDSQRQDIEVTLKNKELELKDQAHRMDLAVQSQEAMSKNLLEEYKLELNSQIELLKLQPDNSNEVLRLVGELAAQITELQTKVDEGEGDVEYDPEGRIVRIGKKRVKRDKDGRAKTIGRVDS